MIQAAQVQKKVAVFATVLLLIATTIVASMSIGSGSLSFDRLLSTILGHGTAKENLVLFSIRLPRIAGQQSHG